MSSPTTVATITPASDRSAADLALVRAGFAAVAAGDLAAFGAVFHDDATWNHRNDDRLGGIHAGRAAICDFLAESVRLTQGTLRPVPETLMADGQGHVAAAMRVSGSREDGRSFDDPQLLLFRIDGDRVRSVEQFIGDHEAVTAFWA
jgi:ketosteroid isomerase-like protein